MVLAVVEIPLDPTPEISEANNDPPLFCKTPPCPPPSEILMFVHTHPVIVPLNTLPEAPCWTNSRLSNHQFANPPVTTLLVSVMVKTGRVPTLPITLIYPTVEFPAARVVIKPAPLRLAGELLNCSVQ